MARNTTKATTPVAPPTDTAVAAALAASAPPPPAAGDNSAAALAALAPPTDTAVAAALAASVPPPPPAAGDNSTAALAAQQAAVDADIGATMDRLEAADIALRTSMTDVAQKMVDAMVAGIYPRDPKLAVDRVASLRKSWNDLPSLKQQRNKLKQFAEMVAKYGSDASRVVRDVIAANGASYKAAVETCRELKALPETAAPSTTAIADRVNAVPVVVEMTEEQKREAAMTAAADALVKLRDTVRDLSKSLIPLHPHKVEFLELAQFAIDLDTFRVRFGMTSAQKKAAGNDAASSAEAKAAVEKARAANAAAS